MTNKYVLTYLLVGTRGGITRGKIIGAIRKTPMNMNKLSNHLKLDYKTVQHHLRILANNNILAIINKGKYGAVYYIAPEMESSMHILDEIWGKSGKK